MFKTDFFIQLTLLTFVTSFVLGCSNLPGEEGCHSPSSMLPSAGSAFIIRRSGSTGTTTLSSTGTTLEPGLLSFLKTASSIETTSTPLEPGLLSFLQTTRSSKFDTSRRSDKATSHKPAGTDHQTTSTPIGNTQRPSATVDHGAHDTTLRTTRATTHQAPSLKPHTTRSTSPLKTTQDSDLTTTDPPLASKSAPTVSTRTSVVSGTTTTDFLLFGGGLATPITLAPASTILPLTGAKATSTAVILASNLEGIVSKVRKCQKHDTSGNDCHSDVLIGFIGKAKSFSETFLTSLKKPSGSHSHGCTSSLFSLVSCAISGLEHLSGAIKAAEQDVGHILNTLSKISVQLKAPHPSDQGGNNHNDDDGDDNDNDNDDHDDSTSTSATCTASSVRHCTSSCVVSQGTGQQAATKSCTNVCKTVTGCSASASSTSTDTFVGVAGSHSGFVDPMPTMDPLADRQAASAQMVSLLSSWGYTLVPVPASTGKTTRKTSAPTITAKTTQTKHSPHSTDGATILSGLLGGAHTPKTTLKTSTIKTRTSGPQDGLMTGKRCCTFMATGLPVGTLAAPTTSACGCEGFSASGDLITLPDTALSHPVTAFSAATPTETLACSMDDGKTVLLSTVGPAPTPSTGIEIMLHYPDWWKTHNIDWRAFWLPSIESSNEPASPETVCPTHDDDHNKLSRYDSPLFIWGTKGAFPGGSGRDKIHNGDFDYPPTMKLETATILFFGDKDSFDVAGHKNCTYFADKDDPTGVPGYLKCAEPAGAITCSLNQRKYTRCEYGDMVPKVWCALPVEGSTTDG